MPLEEPQTPAEPEEAIRYGHITAWSNELGISETAIKLRIKGLNGIVGVTAKKGRSVIAYAEEDIRRVCADILSRPRENKDGYIEIEGKKYRTQTAWARALQLSSPTLVKYFEDLPAIDGIDSRGHILEKAYYSEEDVTKALVHLLTHPQENAEGFIIIENERYATRARWAEILKKNDNEEFLKSMTQQRGISGRDSEGRVYPNGYLPESIITVILEDETHKIPRANPDGFVMHDGQTYGPVERWSKKLSIAKPTIRRRLEQNSKKGITAKTATGAIWQNTFYSEADVKECCMDLLKDNIPVAEADGSLLLPYGEQAEEHRTLNGWAEELKTTDGAIRTRLNGITGVTGICVGGKISQNGFYPASVIYEKCSDLIQIQYQAKEDGFFTDDANQKWGSIEAWMREFSKTRRISWTRLSQKFKGSNSIKARDVRGRIRDYYPEDRYNEICAEIIDDLPQANDSGFFGEPGKRFGTKEAWLKELGQSRMLLEALEASQGIEGRTSTNHARIFYSEEEIMQRFVHLPRADKDGFFTLDNIRYGGLRAWSKDLKVAESVLSRRLKLIQGITGRDRKGKIQENRFFPEHEVKRVMESRIVLLESEGDIPVENEDGYIYIEEKRYATKNYLASQINENRSLIEGLLKGVVGITGKDNMGRIWKEGYFPEEQLQKAYAEFKALPKANDQNEYFADDGTKYASISRWSKLLGVNFGSLRDRFADVKGLKVCDNKNRVYVYYSEESAIVAAQGLKRKIESLAS